MSLKSIITVFSVPFAVGLVFLLAIDKGEAVLFLNNWHHANYDWAVKYGTHLGDGLIFIPLVLLALAYRYRFAITLAITGIFLSILTNILKQVVYTDTERPKRFFEGIHDLHFLDGVEMHGLNSFPSGHTATAAALAILISLESRKPLWVILAVLYAVFIAFSRVYLAQHFLRDVVFGYLEGMAMGILGYLLAQRLVRPYSWSERSLFRS